MLLFLLTLSAVHIINSFPIGSPPFARETRTNNHRKRLLLLHDPLHVGRVLESSSSSSSSRRHRAKWRPAFTVKKLPISDERKSNQKREFKRLSLYPPEIVMDSKNIEQSKQQQQHSVAAAVVPTSRPPSAHRSSWQNHRRPWLNHHQFLGRRKTAGDRRGHNDRRRLHVRESIQTCLFLRSGCEKMQPNHSENRLADFVKNLDVQERITNGFVLRRQRESRKKNGQFRRL